MTRSMLGVGSLGLLAALAAAPALVAQEQPADQRQEAPKAQRRSLVGQTAPVVSLKDCDGKTHSLQDYRGKVVILEWIDPTNALWIQQQQDPAMKQECERYKARGVVYLPIFAFSGTQGALGHQPMTPGHWQQGIPGGQGWGLPNGQPDDKAMCGADAGACSVVKALDEQHAIEVCKRLQQEHGFASPILLDAGGLVTQQYGVERLPHAAIIDKDGQVTYECGVFQFVNALERALGGGTTLPASAPREGEDVEAPREDGDLPRPNAPRGDEEGSKVEPDADQADGPR